MKKLSLYISLLCLILTAGACKNKTGGPATASSELTDDALMDTVQHRTFLYFWEGAEPNSGLAPERYHVDGVYPQNDANVVTSGGSGFGIMLSLRESTAVTSPAKRDWHEWNASFLSSKRQTASTEPTLIGGMVIRAK